MLMKRKFVPCLYCRTEPNEDLLNVYAKGKYLGIYAHRYFFSWQPAEDRMQGIGKLNLLWSVGT